MKSFSTQLQDHLQNKTVTLALCWKLARTDGTTVCFTAHDQDIVYDSNRYYSALGGDPTALSVTDQMNPDTIDLEGLVSENILKNINETDLRTGKYDYAEIWLFLINYADTSQGIIKLRRGRFGKVEIKQGKYKASITSMTDYFSKKICETYSAECRASLFDTRCALASSDYKVSGSVTATTDNRTFTDAASTRANDYFNYGYVDWTAGNNNGLKMEVKDFSTGKKFTLFLAMPKTITVGDTYEAYPGCDKKVLTCSSKYNNIVHFRGEPFVPPESVIAMTPDYNKD